MNVEDYRAAGYSVSTLIQQATISLAEKDVVAAYIVPLIGTIPTEVEKGAEPLKTAIMSLSALLVSQRSIAATRAGAKTKNTPQSNTPTASDLLRQYAPSCARALAAIPTQHHKRPSEVCDDICGIFFKTNFFGNK